MTNGEKYKTAAERGAAFTNFCQKLECRECPAYHRSSEVENFCRFDWLELEATMSAKEVADILAEYITWYKSDHGQSRPRTWEEVNTVIERAVEILRNVEE